MRPGDGLGWFQRCTPLPRFNARPLLLVEVDVRDLPARMHSGVGAAGHHELHVGADDARERGFQRPWTVRRVGCFAHPRKWVPS